MFRSHVLPFVERADPVADAQAIARSSAGIDFPWDTRRAYELALVKTFAVPSSARVLAGTGEFVGATAKRHDDTLYLIATLGMHGYDSPAGKQALRIMNRAHARYAIPAPAYRHTLASFVLEPIRWNARFGWRPLHPHEIQAGFHFWREVGRRMAIPDLPGDLEAMERESDAFEAAEVAPSTEGRTLFRATSDLVLSRSLPPALHGVGLEAVAVLLDDRYRHAFGLPDPRPSVARAVTAALDVRARVVRALPKRRRPVALPRLATYPRGVDVGLVGPAHARATEEDPQP